MSPTIEKADRVRETLDTVCWKWHPYIIFQLYGGKMSFGQLRLELGISSRMLSKSLRELKNQEIVRTDGGSGYVLTSKGVNLKEALDELERLSNK